MAAASAVLAIGGKYLVERATGRRVGKQVRDIGRHNWQEAGKGLSICKDCDAQLEQGPGFKTFTAGDGSCE